MLFGTQIAYAQLDVVFENEPDPLFSEANFLPGNEVIRTVEVSNNYTEAKDVLVEAINASDDDNLGDKLRLVITEGGISRYDNTLGTFLSAGEVPMSELSGNSSTTYLFSITFENDAGNDLQETALGFDLCVGFEGGTMHCGDTVIGDEEDTDGGDSNDGGGVIYGSGGGGGGYIPSLTINNERATNVGVGGGGIPPMNGMATIEWDTTLLATSQVIYGLASDDYILNTNISPYFGYPMGTVEDKTKVTSHSVLLTGLELGKVYKYRVVSRASPATISYERTFLVEMEVGELLDEGGDSDPALLDEQDLGPLAYTDSPATAAQDPSAGFTGQAAGSEGDTGGTSEPEEESEGVSDTAGTDPDQTGSDPEKEVEPSGNLASALLAFLGDDLGIGKIILILLLLLLLFLIARAILKRSKNKGD